MNKLKCALAIAASGVLSIVIATALVNYGAIELGAIIYFIIPACVGISSILFFLLFDNVLEEYRTALTIVFILINILAGTLMRLDFYYHLFNF